MAKQTKAATREAERQGAIEKLKAIIKPGMTIYTILDSVSRSGMSRGIRVLVPYTRDDGTVDFCHPNYNVALAIGWKQITRDGRRQDAIKVEGCGMDMGFHLVYCLARTLYPAGFGCVGTGCPSNDHSNGDRDYTPHYDGTPRTAEEVGKDLQPYRHYHQDGGYALRQRWL